MEQVSKTQVGALWIAERTTALFGRKARESVSLALEGSVVIFENYFGSKYWNEQVLKNYYRDLINLRKLLAAKFGNASHQSWILDDTPIIIGNGPTWTRKRNGTDDDTWLFFTLIANGKSPRLFGLPVLALKSHLAATPSIFDMLEHTVNLGHEAKYDILEYKHSGLVCQFRVEPKPIPGRAPLFLLDPSFRAWWR